MCAYLLILGVSAAGMAGLTPWAAVPAGAVALLWLSDRGQHRALAARFKGIDEKYVLSLSIGASLTLALFFCALAFASGAALRWLWLG